MCLYRLTLSATLMDSRSGVSSTGLADITPMKLHLLKTEAFKELSHKNVSFHFQLIF
jgi:hypothetical protein